MTELTITPKVSDKTARFRGTVAAGEHVAVTIKCSAEWMGEDDGANLMLRVLDLVTGRTLAVFPRPAETLEDGDEPDAWSATGTDSEDLYCELNLNTDRMVAAARHMLRVPVLFVLGDTDNPRTLYFRDRHEIEYWPERIGDTAPYSLDKWPKRIDEWQETLDSHLSDNSIHVTAEKQTAWTAKYDKPQGGIPKADLSSAVQTSLGKADTALQEHQSLASYVTGGAYNPTSKKILLKHNDVTISEIDAAAFVKDGMVSSVTVSNGNLVITFNTDAGKSPISIPITSIFNPSNYYDKTASDGRYVQKEAGKGLVAVDDTLAVQGAAADAKATGEAFDGKRGTDDLSYMTDSWFVSGAASFRLDKTSNPYQWTATVDGVVWALYLRPAEANSDWTFGTASANATVDASEDVTSLTFTINGATYTLKKGDRIALASDVPTKTSDLTNDSGFLTQHQDIGGKLDGAAAYPAWERGTVNPIIVSHNGCIWRRSESALPDSVNEPQDGSSVWTKVSIDDLKQDALSTAQMAAVNSGATAAKVATWDGYATQIAQKANTSDLPYAMVTPGEWTFSGIEDWFSVTGIGYFDSLGIWELSVDGDGWSSGVESSGASTDTSVEFNVTETVEPYRQATVIATKTGIHLLDRAVNAVPVLTDTTLTLPAAATGKARDFLVRLTVSASSTVTWTVATGETWDAMGAPPSLFAAGTYLYRITEVADGVWHCEDMLALVGLESALAGKIPMYPMVAVTPTSGTLTVAPYTVATYTAGSSAAAFMVAVGTGVTGKARDCELVIDCTATGAVAPTVTWPATFHPRTDAGTDFACEAGVRNVYYISEYATGQYAVGGWQETAGGNA